MESPGSVFADNFMKGFSLMDAYYYRQDQRDKSSRQEKRQQESHDLNMETLGLQNKKLKREDWARQYQSIVSDKDGNPLNLNNLSPEELKQKKQQFVGFVNGYEPILNDLIKQNPNRQSVDNVDIIMDRKTGKPMLAVNFKMKDGSVKPMTTNASADPKDNVALLDLGYVDNTIKGYLGQDMGIKPTMREARAKKEATDAATLEHSRAKELAYIKYGGTPGPTGNGVLNSKDIKTLKSDTYKLISSGYGSSGLNGISFEEGKREKRDVANVIADDLINSGQVTDAGTGSALAVQYVDSIYNQGGSVKYDKQSKQWQIWGKDADNNDIMIRALRSEYTPDKAKPVEAAPKEEKKNTGPGLSDQERSDLRKRANAGDRDAAVRLYDDQEGYLGGNDNEQKPLNDYSLDSFMKKAREMNKGMSDDDIKAQYYKLGYDKKAESISNAKKKARENASNKNQDEKESGRTPKPNITLPVSKEEQEKRDKKWQERQNAGLDSVKPGSQRRHSARNNRFKSENKTPPGEASLADVKPGRKNARSSSSGDAARQKKSNDALRKFRYYVKAERRPDSKYVPTPDEYRAALESEWITDSEKEEIKRKLNK